jgi:regulator of protease activity HflC (stomatin/prohibitin superfamily)
MIMPFADNVRTVSITPIAMEVDIPVGAQGSITKDNQTIGTDLTVFYRFKSTELVNIAKNFGFDILKEKLAKDTTEAFKQTIGQYTIFDVASKQEEIRDKFILAVNEKIGAYPLFVDDIKVSNYDWSDSFDEQIALTMKIAQESKQQEQELKKIEISAQQQVVQAQANFDAEKLNAEAKKVK